MSETEKPILRCYSVQDMIAFNIWERGLTFEQRCKVILENGKETIYKNGYITESKTDRELVEEWHKLNYQ